MKDLVNKMLEIENPYAQADPPSDAFEDNLIELLAKKSEFSLADAFQVAKEVAVKLGEDPEGFDVRYIEDVVLQLVKDGMLKYDSGRQIYLWRMEEKKVQEATWNKKGNKFELRINGADSMYFPSEADAKRAMKELLQDNPNLRDSDMDVVQIEEALPGEVHGGADEIECEDCGRKLPLKVLQSGAGYYYGYWCPECGPYGRESGYFGTREEAEAAMAAKADLRDTDYHGPNESMLREMLSDDDLKNAKKVGKITWKVMKVYDKEKKPLYIGNLKDVEKKFGLTAEHFWQGDPYKILQYLQRWYPDAYSWEVPAETVWEPGDTDTVDKALEQPTPEQEIDKNLKELPEGIDDEDDMKDMWITINGRKINIAELAALINAQLDANVTDPVKGTADLMMSVVKKFGLTMDGLDKLMPTIKQLVSMYDMKLSKGGSNDENK